MQGADSASDIKDNNVKLKKIKGALTENEAEDIRLKFVVPMVKTDVTRLIRERDCTQRSSDIIQIMAKVILVTATALSVVEAANPEALRGVSSILNILALSTFSLSSYLKAESKERTTALNAILKESGISVIDLTDFDEE